VEATNRERFNFDEIYDVLQAVALVLEEKYKSAVEYKSAEDSFCKEMASEKITVLNGKSVLIRLFCLFKLKQALVDSPCDNKPQLEINRNKYFTQEEIALLNQVNKIVILNPSVWMPTAKELIIGHINYREILSDNIFRQLKLFKQKFLIFVIRELKNFIESNPDNKQVVEFKKVLATNGYSDSDNLIMCVIKEVCAMSRGLSFGKVKNVTACFNSFEKKRSDLYKNLHKLYANNVGLDISSAVKGYLLSYIDDVGSENSKSNSKGFGL